MCVNSENTYCVTANPKVYYFRGETSGDGQLAAYTEGEGGCGLLHLRLNVNKFICGVSTDTMTGKEIKDEIKRGYPLVEMGASFQIKLWYQNPRKQR